MSPSASSPVRSESLLDRLAASRDLWPSGVLDHWQGRPAPLPREVVWPESEDQVATVLARAAQERAAVVTYGAGSGVCGGARGLQDAITLDTKRLDAIGEVDEARWMVEVEAGVNGQRLEDHLAALGYTVGHSPSSIGCSTVGGWAAARGAGQFSSRYGVFEDMVLGLDAVAPGIGPFHMGLPGPQSPAQRGPDGWFPLLLGSEGTLAVITRLRLRVWPLPPTRWLRGYRFHSVSEALDAMRQLMQGELWPSVLRLYDPIDTWIGGKTKPKKAAREGRSWLKEALACVDRVPALRSRSLVPALSVPRLLQRVAGGLSSGCLLVVGWEGDAQVVDAAVQAGRVILDARGDDLGADPGERWYASRHAVSYKLMPIFERGGFADTMEVACRWSAMHRVWDAVRDAVSHTALCMAHMSHLYPEGGSLYFSFAGRGDRAVYDRTWQAALDAALGAGATVTHHHGVGMLKAGHATAEAGAARRGWEALKRQLDPAGLLNPGRLFHDVEPVGSAPPPEPEALDGLAEVDAAAPTPDAVGGARVRWRWAEPGGPPPWQRQPWQTSWVDVYGQVDGLGVALGRAPRSATGPDLRRWLASHADAPRCTVGVVDPSQPVWCGEATLDAPWQTALALLRSDLRPAVLVAEGRRLAVGFVGPAAEAFGAIASERVPGGLSACALPSPVLPVEPLTLGDPSSAGASHVTVQGVWTRGDA